MCYCYRLGKRMSALAPCSSVGGRMGLKPGWPPSVVSHHGPLPGGSSPLARRSNQAPSWPECTWCPPSVAVRFGLLVSNTTTNANIAIISAESEIVRTADRVSPSARKELDFRPFHPQEPAGNSKTNDVVRELEGHALSWSLTVVPRVQLKKTRPAAPRAANCWRNAHEFAGNLR